jgi:hypothetical protein
VTVPIGPDPALFAAAWDVPLLRGATWTFAAVAARLPTWRMRWEAVGRSLGDAECWSGPAAQSAAQAVLELSVVATSVDTALAHSGDAFERLLLEAAAAQELAAAARAGTDAIELPRVAAVDEHVAAAEAAARAAGEALDHVTATGHVAPATFWDLVGRVTGAGPTLPPAVPRGRDAATVAAWWAGLSAVDQLAAIRTAPAAVGASDGLPAWARDRANRMVLAEALADPRTAPYARFTARVIAARIAAEEAAGQPVQLQLLDLAGDRVALALGDLDTADDVALLVPGIGTTPGDDLGDQLQSASDVAAAARTAAPAAAVATVAWLGYRTPSGPPGLALRGAARRGGPALAAALDGLAAARTAAGRPGPRITVLAHSYGTVVVDAAAHEPGRLAADAVVLLGSPGMTGKAADLEVPQVFDGAAPGDPISWLGWFGGDPWAQAYGATELPTETWMQHSDYYSPSRPTLAAIGEVVAGRRPPD